MTGNGTPSSAQRSSDLLTTASPELTSLTAEGDTMGNRPIVIMMSDWTLCTQTSLRIRFSLFEWLQNALKRFRVGS